MLQTWQYKRSQKWLNVPSWAKKYAYLGGTVAEYSHADKRLVIGLSMPTRAFASVFMALGVVIIRALQPIDEIDNANHFLRLCNLPEGSSLYYRKKDKFVKAKLMGYESNKWGNYISIKLNNKFKVEKIPSSMVHQLQLADEEFDELPKSSRGSRIENKTQFIKATIGDVDVEKYCEQKRLDLLMLGNASIISDEIKLNIKLDTESGNSLHGTPKDILRFKKGVHYGQGYRSDLQSAKSAPYSVEQPHVVILDGSKAFLKWRDLWPESNLIVLLDKTEPRFEEAVETFNKEYVYNRLKSEMETIPRFPKGVEGMFYEEKK